ncbi:glycosyltransferase [Cyclobacterium xiamenense]|uniref:glycosyltransferase n=1 Tax=Cyclobacterium xiamenense TaxID=1297121 RepID=UPI0012B6BD24|nr:glycosyltransferase [Cyclobacterium xiamenense]
MVIHSLQAGGMERVMSEIVNHAASLGTYEVHVVLFGVNPEVFYPLADGITVHRPHFKFDRSRLFISSLRTLYFLRKTLSHLQPHAALSFGEYWNSFVLISLLGTSVPLFVSDRSQPGKALSRTQERLRNWLYPKAKGVIAQTSNARRIYKTKYKHPNITVIGNPIRQILSGPYREEGRENTILMVGRLIATKHQDRLIRIFLEIDERNWKLVLVGYDHLKQNHRARLQHMIDENGAQDRIFLVGKQANVDSYYLKSKIFAFTSSSEGFPNVIGEALSAGLPVVAYDCDSGPSDLIHHGQNGFLVPVFDDKRFKACLSRLMQDHLLRTKMAINATRSVKKFKREKIAQRFLDFLAPR